MARQNIYANAHDVGNYNGSINGDYIGMTDENAPEGLKLHDDFGDPEALLNIRGWLRSAVEAKGAEFTGGGIGMGAADIDVDLEGMRYNIKISPR